MHGSHFASLCLRKREGEDSKFHCQLCLWVSPFEHSHCFAKLEDTDLDLDTILNICLEGRVNLKFWFGSFFMKLNKCAKFYLNLSWCLPGAGQTCADLPLCFRIENRLILRNQGDKFSLDWEFASTEKMFGEFRRENNEHSGNGVCPSLTRWFEKFVYVSRYFYSDKLEKYLWANSSKSSSLCSKKTFNCNWSSSPFSSSSVCR
jgi:hypothetical protein